MSPFAHKAMTPDHVGRPVCFKDTGLVVEGKLLGYSVDADLVEVFGSHEPDVVRITVTATLHTASGQCTIGLGPSALLEVLA